jgi:beta-glucanase (GH16 family)
MKKHYLTLFLGGIFLLCIQSCRDSSIQEESGRDVNKVGEWQLVWQDEFSEQNIDLAKWSFEQNCWGGGNKEKQCYTNRETNAYLKDGKLHIVAQKEEFTGAKLGEHFPDYDANDTRTLPYTSAKLYTKGKADWLYGRFEIRAKLPGGQGIWPAIWMLPSDNKYGGWPASGEIDIMEAVNLNTTSVATETSPAIVEKKVHGTLHHGASWPDNIHTGTGYSLPDNASPSDTFHTYAIEWQAGEIRWYVDQKHYATQRSDNWYSGYKDENGNIKKRDGDSPFDHPFYLLLNLAVGGAWPESENLKGVDPQALPAELTIDFVKVYQCSNAQETCASVDPTAKLVNDGKENFGGN